MTAQSQPKPVEVSLAIVLRPADKTHALLITKRPAKTVYAGYWELPGGKIDAGESPEQAVVREIDEELGITIEPYQQLDTVEHRYDHAHVLLHPFYCRHTAGEPRNIEVAEHRWVPLSDLDQFAFPEANTPIFQRILADHAPA